MSYAHEDVVWKERLVRQLGAFVQRRDLDVWDDTAIRGGDEWRDQIEAALATAAAAVLLVSSDFLASTFVQTVEVPTLLRRREHEGLRVIPVLVRHCVWDVVDWLAPMQIRPPGVRPLDSFRRSNFERHLSDVAREVEQALESARANPAMAAVASSETSGLVDKVAQRLRQSRAELGLPPDAVSTTAPPLDGARVHIRIGTAHGAVGTVYAHHLPRALGHGQVTVRLDEPIGRRSWVALLPDEFEIIPADNE